MTCDTTGLEGALRRLETALETPVIAGEMPDWCEAVQHELVSMEQELHRAVREKHVAILAEIMEFDPEQGPRVERLKQVDGELLDRADKLKGRFQKLSNATEMVEPDELRVVDHVEQFIQVGLQLIIDIRRHEIGIATWHSESLKRDRGVVD